MPAPSRSGSSVSIPWGTSQAPASVPTATVPLYRARLSWLWKALLFNGATLLLYWLLMHLLGMAQLAAEFAEMGAAMTAVLLVLGNVTFFLLDRLLGIGPKKRK